MDPTLKAIFTNYAVLLPIILAWISGFIVALVRWRRHPKVSMLACIAFGLFLLQLLVDTSLNVWLPRWLVESQRMSSSDVSSFMLVKGVVSNFIRTVLWALLIIAIFGWRAERRESSSSSAPASAPSAEA